MQSSFYSIFSAWTHRLILCSLFLTRPILPFSNQLHPHCKSVASASPSLLTHNSSNHWHFKHLYPLSGWPDRHQMKVVQISLLTTFKTTDTHTAGGEVSNVAPLVDDRCNIIGPKTWQHHCLLHEGDGCYYMLLLVIISLMFLSLSNNLA